MVLQNHIAARPLREPVGDLLANEFKLPCDEIFRFLASILAWVGLRPYLNLRMSLIGSLTASESANEPQRISAT
jgi:hypothetical protein